MRFHSSSSTTHPCPKKVFITLISTVLWCLLCDLGVIKRLKLTRQEKTTIIKIMTTAGNLNYLKKYISLVLFIVLAVQLTGLNCVGEDSSFSDYGIQGDSQTIIAAESADQSSHNSGSAGETHQCPCHLSFTLAPPMSITSTLSIVASLTLPTHPSLKLFPTLILQPPKVLL